MRKEDIEYLESIGITGELLDRTRYVFNFYTKILGYDVEEIFVSEFINKDDSREYENLWLFSGDFCFEAKQFLTKMDYDVDVMRNSIYNFNIKANNINFEDNKIDNSSRIVFEAKINWERYMFIKASKSNCEKLIQIINKYIVPNTFKNNNA